MTTIPLVQGRAPATGRPARSRSIARQILLLCGILSSLLYVATDVLGGLRYASYSFTAQTISELAAIGAPTRPFVDPLFTAYLVLLLAFGVGVVRESARWERALCVAGALLIAIAAIGLASAPFTAIHVRGSEWALSDTMHVIGISVTVVLILVAMAFGVVALGRRFRIFSVATFLVLITSGALIGGYVSRLAAQQPTPGLGIVERVNVYAYLLWVLVLAAALLRRSSVPRPADRSAIATAPVNGFVAPGFEEVRAEFERNFAERGEIGAAVAAYWRGTKVVDLWGGWRTPDRDAPWDEDTMVVVMSTTKGLSAMALAVANARGWLDYNASVARYWPEFAQCGKSAVTVRQLLGHEAGLVLLDEKLPIEKLRDLDYVARVLSRQKPAWPPGSRHGYHTITIGLYMQELIRRADPSRRSLGRFFAEEIAKPLGLEFYIGLPKEIPAERLAQLKTLSLWRGLRALRYTPIGVTMKMITPGSLLRRSFVGAHPDWNDRRWFEVEIPAGNGVGTARAIARAYSAFAEGGPELGITPETFARIVAPPVMPRGNDVVLGVPSYFSLGFLRPGPEIQFGASEHAFGAPGAGGSFAFADPDAHLGYAYVMNKLDFYLTDDPREKALRDAVYRAIARFSAGAPAEEAGDVSSRAGATR